MEPQHRVAIIFPSGDKVHADFAANLAVMVGYSGAHGVALGIYNPRSSMVCKSRHIGVLEALSGDRS